MIIIPKKKKKENRGEMGGRTGDGRRKYHYVLRFVFINHVKSGKTNN